MNIPTTRLSGFTLMEMLAVIVIMALLVSVSVPVYQNYSDRARSSEIIARYDALRTNVATSMSGGQFQSCDELASEINTSNLGEDYADLALGFEAIVGNGGTGISGWRPVLTVCASNDNQGNAAVRVARATFDELSNLHRVEAGAVVSDAIVSFSLPLTLGNEPACSIAASVSVSGCSGSSQQAPPQPSPQLAPSQISQASPPTPGPLTAPPVINTPAQVTQATPQAIQQSTPVAPPVTCPTGQKRSNSDPQACVPIPAPPAPSQILLCGDLGGTNAPCEDLDLVLAMTNLCQADKPFGINTLIVVDDRVLEYRACGSADDVAQAVANSDNQDCRDMARIGNQMDVKAIGDRTPGIVTRCDFACYGDGCNTLTIPPASTRIDSLAHRLLESTDPDLMDRLRSQTGQ